MNYNYLTVCCKNMEEHLLLKDEKLSFDGNDLSDKIVYYSSIDNSFYIPIKTKPCHIAKNGVKIYFCPWCGKRLTEYYNNSSICSSHLGTVNAYCNFMKKNIYMILEKIFFDNTDIRKKIIYYNSKYDEYGIPIVDNYSRISRSTVSILFCPWCGIQLPDKRELWFDTLEEMGFDSPFEQDIPEKFKSSAWWKSK